MWQQVLPEFGNTAPEGRISIEKQKGKMILNYVDKMKRAFLRRVEAAGILSNRAPGWRRRLRNEKRKRKFSGGRIIKVRSFLWIKRNFTDNHVRARLYKRTFRGIVGAHSWKTLDKMFPRPKAARRVMKAVPKPPENIAMPKQSFLAKVASALRITPRKSLA